jgi:hypothetical protein
VLSVDHPTADAVEGERFNKEDVPHVRVNLYRGTVTIEFPLHSFSDYISPTLLNYFEIVELKEATATDRDYQDGPNQLLYAARKKS